MLRKFAVLFIVLITISSTTNFAQDNKQLDKRLKLIEVNCIKSLDVDLEAIVETSIYNSIVFKTRYADYNFENILDALKEVSEKNVNPSIKYQAQLAILFIENYNLFDGIQVTAQYTPVLYKEISMKIHNKIALR